MSFWSDIGDMFKAGWNNFKDGYQIGDITKSLFGIGSDVYNAHQQKNQFEYMKEQQQTQYDRADNQIQRTVADAQAAGVNPLAALGKGGAVGNPLNTTAPQMNGDNTFKAAQNQIARQQAAIARKQAIIAERNGEADINYKNAQADYYRAMAGDVPENRADVRKGLSLQEARDQVDAAYKNKESSTHERSVAVQEYLSEFEAEKLRGEGVLNWTKVEECKKNAEKISTEIGNLLVKRDLDSALIGTEETKQVLNKAAEWFYYIEGEHLKVDDFLNQLNYELDKNRVELQEAKNNIERESIVARIISAALGPIILKSL